MKKLFILFFILIIPASDLFAFEKQAEKFIIETTTKAKEIILNTKINDLDKKKFLENLVVNSVDIEGLAKFTLGAEAKKLTDKEMEKFTTNFRTFFSKNISNKLKDYSDQNVVIIGSKMISENYVLVNSKIVSNKNKQEILVDWRVFFLNQKLIIRDLVVEGLSLARTQREEFASIIANKGFKGLNESLNSYINKN